MTTVGLLRHFETDWNALGRLQGRTDRPLTEAARAQADALGFPESWRAARLVSSPLSRAVETAERLSGRAPEIAPELIELSWGEWEGRTGAELLADPASGYAHVENWGWGKRPPGGESPADAWARIAPRLAALAAEGRPALLVIHRGLMRVILAKAWRWDFDRKEPFRIKRERVYPVELSPAGAPLRPLPEERLVPKCG